ncbi:MAG: glycosyltransferase family 2 protein [Nitrospinota bacterium]|nr:glycosyltransferase family 2 protein [Nitrospinota bacterium]
MPVDGNRTENFSDPDPPADLDISIIIPLFNEVESLNELHERVTAVMAAVGLSYELLFIDDGSQDNSAGVIETFANQDPKVSLVSLKRNYGKSNALMVGFQRARGARAITLDADLQDIPENIPSLLAKENYDLVNGYRKDRKDKPIKRVLSTLFNKLINLVFKIDSKDLNSGFKVYKREFYKSLNLYGDLHRFIPVLAKMDGASFIEVAVEHAPRKHGHSKYPLFRIRGIWDIMSLSMMSSLQLRPFHFFAFYGLLILAGSLILFLYLLASENPDGGFTLARPLFITMSILGMNSFIVGLQLEVTLNVYRKKTICNETIKKVRP